MTLFTRLGRLLRADLHTVIDGLEEPAAALREALRDMRHALARAAEDEARLVREAERLAQALEIARTQAARAAEDLTLCLDADAGEVARTAMRRRLEADARVAALTGALERQRAQCDACGARLAAQRERLAALEARAALLPATDESAAEPLTWSAASPAISEADITLALHAERARRARA